MCTVTLNPSFCSEKISHPAHSKLRTDAFLPERYMLRGRRLHQQRKLLLVSITHTKINGKKEHIQNNMECIESIYRAHRCERSVRIRFSRDKMRGKCLARAGPYFGKSGVASAPGDGMRCHYLDPKGWTYTGAKASPWQRRLHLCSNLAAKFRVLDCEVVTKHFQPQTELHQ